MPGAWYFMSGGTQRPGSLWIANDAQAGETRLTVRHFDGQTERAVIPSSSSTVIDFGPSNSWTHVALVRSGNQFTLYLNGLQAATSTHAGLSLAPYDIFIGGDGTTQSSLLGHIDELRVSMTAVYSGNFAPPSGPFA